MSSMMGAPAGGQEDMFQKLESMREVITEVNTQFKDPVRMRLRFVESLRPAVLTPCPRFDLISIWFDFGATRT